VTLKSDIPKSFQLCGHQIVVRTVPKSKWKYKGDVGCWDYANLTIELVAGQQPSVAMQTFAHEWAHAMLEMMAHPLARDERFVDQLGHLLQQSVSTFEYQNATKSK
jgi:hypothetical protein